MNFCNNIPPYQINNNPMFPNDLIYHINELENKIQKLEQRITRLENNTNQANIVKEPDTGLYML